MRFCPPFKGAMGATGAMAPRFIHPASSLHAPRTMRPLTPRKISRPATSLLPRRPPTTPTSLPPCQRGSAGPSSSSASSIVLRSIDKTEKDALKKPSALFQICSVRTGQTEPPFPSRELGLGMFTTKDRLLLAGTPVHPFVPNASETAFSRLLGTIRAQSTSLTNHLAQVDTFAIETKIEAAVPMP